MTDYVASQVEQANTSAEGTQSSPRIASMPGGGWVVAWSTGGASGVEIHAQVFDASGAKSGGEVTVFSAELNPPGTNFDMGEIAVLNDGSFVVTAATQWLVSPPQAAPYQIAIFGQRVSASGQLADPPVQIESHVQQNDFLYASSVVATPGGGWAAVVQDASRVPPFTIGNSLRVYDASGNPLATAGLAGNDTPVVSQFPNGNILQSTMNWSPGPSTISWQVLTPAGQSLATVVTSSQQGTVQQFYTATAVLSSGIGVVVYSQNTLPLTDPPQTSWHVQMVNDQGQPVGADRVLDFTPDTPVRLTALTDGGFLMTWMQSGGNGMTELMGRHYDANANPAGNVDVLDADISVVPDRYGAIPYRIVPNADGGFEVVTVQNHAATSLDIELTKFVVAGGSSGEIDVHGGITPIPDGSYAIVGSAGLDQISFAGAHTLYTVTQGSVSGPGGSDTLAGVERIHFGDGYAIALDVNGDAGEAYRLYKAAFNREPDLPGLGFQMNDLDMGYSLAHVAQNFIDSPEFQATYGTGISNTEFITLLYRNVLGREPEQAGLDYHLNEFAQGDTRANMLTHFSESPENQANVIGQIKDGMLYIPFE